MIWSTNSNGYSWSNWARLPLSLLIDMLFAKDKKPNGYFLLSPLKTAPKGSMILQIISLYIMLLTTDPHVYGFHPNMPFAPSRLFCGCISPRFGCAMACTVWLVLDVYIAALAFQGYTPVFSFLTKPALYTLAGISTFFAIISLLLLAGLLLV
ncbi:hypothetical protein K501DRAFT_309768, partial [Backusella circina FSU 941]